MTELEGHTAERIASALEGIDNELYRIAEALEALVECTFEINQPRTNARAFRVSNIGD